MTVILHLRRNINELCKTVIKNYIRARARHAKSLSSAGAQPDFFQGRGGFVGLGHFCKHFVKNTRKKGPASKNLVVIFPRYSKTTF